MRVDHLKEMIEICLETNEIPFFVNATSGTTVLGSFDPLNEIADVCEKYGIWLHVDVCFF
jgi:glutamate/tyrosine decarboxylase-like PLP-dependent enzyme